MRTFTAAVVQDAPVLFDLEDGLRLVEDYCRKAQQQNCQHILFPESFLPGYPRGFDFGSVVGSRSDAGKKLWQRYYATSVDAEGPTTERLSDLARTYKLFLAIGVTERSKQHGSLFCSIFYFSPAGRLEGVHRKLKPTGSERIIWAEGATDSLVTFSSDEVRFGGLICWENYMPLARMSMYRKNLHLYMAPTADHRESWVESMKHIAREGRCYVLAANQYTTDEHIPSELSPYLSSDHPIHSEGGSLICGPDGKLMAGPLRNQKGLLTATIDLDFVEQQRMEFDVNGHYNRPDQFHFDVPGQPDIKKISI